MVIVTKEIYAEMSEEQRAELLEELITEYGEKPKACLEGSAMLKVLKKLLEKEQFVVHPLMLFNGNFYCLTSQPSVTYLTVERVSSDDL